MLIRRKVGGRGVRIVKGRKYVEEWEYYYVECSMLRIIEFLWSFGGY